MKKIKDIFFHGKDIRGEVGIEIEMEGSSFPLEDLDSWYSREDGSLRGDKYDGSREFVLIRPCKREDVHARIASLSTDLKEMGSTINPSYRTGVHIHTNVRDMTFTQVYNYIFTYFVFEDILMNFAGKEREGNLFCLRLKDAEGLLELLAESIKKKDLKVLHSDNIRYSSMNLKAIKQYGSIEFRGLPFSGDFDQIEVWTSLLLAVKDYSLTLESPRNLVENLSKLGNVGLAKTVFKDLTQHLPTDQWQTLLEGVRRVQHLIYLTDWEDKVTYFNINTNLEINYENIKQRQQDNLINNNAIIGGAVPRAFLDIGHIPPAVRQA